MSDTCLRACTQVMRQWSVKECADFLRGVDLCAAAASCEGRDVTGADLVDATVPFWQPRTRRADGRSQTTGRTDGWLDCMGGWAEKGARASVFFWSSSTVDTLTGEVGLSAWMARNIVAAKTTFVSGRALARVDSPPP